MDKHAAMQAYREQYERGEIDGDDYEVALLGIEYAAEQAASAQDEMMGVAS